MQALWVCRVMVVYCICCFFCVIVDDLLSFYQEWAIWYPDHWSMRQTPRDMSGSLLQKYAQHQHRALDN